MRAAPANNFYDPELYDRDVCLGRLVRRVMASIVYQADRRLTPLGLTHAQWSPLLRLIACGECTVASLSHELDLDAGALTRLLDRLEAKGLCQRTRSSEDRRVVMVSLTEDGEHVAADIPPVLAEVFNAHLAGFSESEWHDLISMLQRIVATGDTLRGEAKNHSITKK